jgi:2-C-methyl-D-erythritol 4-phosphate cytidylyltransferase
VTPSRRSNRTIAVILAAGAGTRSGLERPKQFLRLGGRSVLEHTLHVFDESEGVDELLIVAAANCLQETEAILSVAGLCHDAAIIRGGATRNLSTAAAIDHLAARRIADDAKILVHDAVRPLVEERIIEDCLSVLDTHPAVDVAIETADTIIETDGEVVTSIPPRARLRRGQTPQGFRFRTLRRAYELTPPPRLEQFTDDCAVVLAALPETTIAVVPGAEANVKITHPVDVYLADHLLQLRQSSVPRSGSTALPDADLGVVVVVGGSSGIGKAIAEDLGSRGTEVVPLSRRDDVDVRDETTLRRALRHTRADLGPISAVVNTAATLTYSPLVDLDPDVLKSELDTNLLGAFNVARAAYPHLKETAGHLLLFTSSSYMRGRANYAPYSASKAATVNLTQALADEWLVDGIKVNCLNPARTRTPMRTTVFGDEPPTSLLTPHRVADVAAHVLRSASTGHVYDIRPES